MNGAIHDVGRWDLLVAHPPCTYLSNAGASFLWKGKELQADRLMKGIHGRDLFMRFWWADIPKICIENPVPSKVFCLPAYGTNMSDAAGAAAQAAGSAGGGSGGSTDEKTVTNSLGGAVGSADNSMATQAARRAMNVNNPNR